LRLVVIQRDLYVGIDEIIPRIVRVDCHLDVQVDRAIGESRAIALAMSFFGLLGAPVKA